MIYKYPESQQVVFYILLYSKLLLLLPYNEIMYVFRFIFTEHQFKNSMSFHIAAFNKQIPDKNTLCP